MAENNRTPAAGEWTTVIRPRSGWFDIDLQELWRYRDLIGMFVKRNFTVLYKQTILGPAWIILNPLITTVLFNVVFGGLAGLSTDGTPSFLFYMAGNTVWTFFSTCINNTANTFVANSQVFGKVYFPRLTTPISQALTSLINFFIQFVMFALFWAGFALSGAPLRLTPWLAADVRFAGRLPAFEPGRKPAPARADEPEPDDRADRSVPHGDAGQRHGQRGRACVQPCVHAGGAGGGRHSVQPH